MLMLASSTISCLSMAQGFNSNYVAKFSHINPLRNQPITTIQYYDAIGRPTLLDEANVNPSSAHRYSLTTYDRFEKKDTIWLPTESMDFRDDRHSEVTYDITGHKEFVSTPGLGSKGKLTKRYTNTNYSVKKYSSNAIEYEFYPSGMLTCERMVDEDGHSIEIYKNICGNKILERRSEVNDTYYVYDNRNRLVFVLQPMYQEQPDLDKYAFCYSYDNKNRMITKKLPGCGTVYYTYDNADRIVSTKDAVGNIHFFMYDKFGRVAITGTCREMLPNDIMYMNVSQATSEALNWEHTGYEYDTLAFSLSDPVIESVNYYDDYSFLDNLSIYNNCEFYQPSHFCANSLQTGGMRRTSYGEKILFVDYYDVEGNIISHQENILGGGILKKETFYSFTNKPISTTTTLQKNGSTYIVMETYIYDEVSDKLTTIYISYNGEQPVQVESYTYDSLGRIQSTTNGNGTCTSYLYDIRSQLLQTNSERNGSTVFEEHLFYDDGSPTNSTACFNGNVSCMKWAFGNNRNLHQYNYSYDQLDRLTAAEYTTSNPKTNYSVWYSYDSNGNPQSVLRYDGLNMIDNMLYHYDGNQISKISDSAGSAVNYGFFDFKKKSTNNTIEYIYDNNGSIIRDRNKGLQRITYDVNNNPKTMLFSDGNATTYTYTSEGKKLRTVYLNTTDELASHYIFYLEDLLNANELLYSDSAASEISRELYENEYADITLSLTQIDYIDNFIFENNRIAKYLFGSGYISFDISGNPVYHFYIKDHLGSVRVVANQEGMIEQKNTYFPYGGMISRQSSNYGIQPYKYNGKELDMQHGLELYDYGARMYDPANLRWSSVDPLAEKYPNLSPYVYCGGNPVNRIDPMGMDYWSTNDPSQILQFLNAVGSGNTQFDFSGWSHATDAEFRGNLVYNDESHKFYTSYAEVTNGEIVVSSKSFDANITPVSTTGMGYPGAFVYEPVNGFWENANYYLNGLTYNDGFTNWNVNRSGRITGVAPILGIADFGGKSKTSYIKSILPKGFKLAHEFMSHNEKVYEYNGKYYSFDNTSHNGGVWKVFIKKGGRLHRIGTADKNLNIFKK